MTNRYSARKLARKQKRCEVNIEKDCNVAASREGPTKYVGILNAGLSTGLSEELLLETVEKYGDIKKLFMLPNKSYCFLECSDVDSAISIVQNMNGVSKLGQNDSVVYLSFFEKNPKEDEKSTWLKPLPEGLLIVNDFVSEQEELELLKILNMDNDDFDSNLKHRKVKHFGYEFLYGVNNVDPQQKLDREIPVECSFLWERLDKERARQNLSFDWQQPDQLTVNTYAPGQGIPSHVDTHSAFLDPIISLSLEGDIVMDFRKGSNRCSVLLPRRSLLIMTGESRYDWAHGITPRMMDVILTANGNLSTQRRSKRTSLTFRKLRNGLCNCKYPTLCDSQLKDKSLIENERITGDKAALLEEINVHKVYDRIAEHFSETRHSQWPRVAEFLKTFDRSSVLIDVGCGNGKYLNSNPNLLNIGCDRSSGLLKLCNSLGYNVFRCDCLQIPIRSNSVDGCISIAVIHHLATAERRLDAIKELVRILRPTGRGLIYVWAKNQKADNKKSSYLRQNKSLNKNKTTEEELRQKTKRDLEEKAKQSPVELPIHSNRTTFEQQDVLVPWKCTAPQVRNEEKSTFLRYYHVFEDSELEQLLQGISDIKVKETYYDQGNYCCIFEKIKIST